MNRKEQIRTAIDNQDFSIEPPGGEFLIFGVHVLLRDDDPEWDWEWDNSFHYVSITEDEFNSVVDTEHQDWTAVYDTHLFDKAIDDLDDMLNDIYGDAVLTLG